MPALKLFLIAAEHPWLGVVVVGLLVALDDDDEEEEYGRMLHGYDDEDRPSPSFGKACPTDEELFSQSQMNELVWL